MSFYVVFALAGFGEGLLHLGERHRGTKMKPPRQQKIGDFDVPDGICCPYRERTLS